MEMISNGAARTLTDAETRTTKAMSRVRMTEPNYCHSVQSTRSPPRLCCSCFKNISRPPRVYSFSGGRPNGHIARPQPQRSKKTSRFLHFRTMRDRWRGWQDEDAFQHGRSHGHLHI